VFYSLAKESVPMSRGAKFARELRREFDDLRRRNPRYSLRAFARDMRMSPATLSRVLGGKRTVSEATIEKALRGSRLRPEIKERIRQTAFDPYVAASTESDFRPFIENWYFSAVMCLAETPAFREDHHWIATRLGITPKQAATAMSYLEKKGLWVRDPKTGRLISAELSISSRSAPKGPDKNHLGKLQLVRRALLNDDDKLKELSSISSVLQPVDLKNLPEAKDRIHKFRRRLSKFLDAGNKSEVYLLYIQLVPVSILDT
jgi:hypothetical protein